MKSINKYDMRLNPAKYTSGIQTGKFIGFILRRRSIEANPDKCQAVITMRSPIYVKEVHQFRCRLATLSCFLSCASNKAFLFFTTLIKKERFEWTSNYKEDFTKINDFFTSPIILTRSREESPLLFYLSVIDQEMNAVFVQEIDKTERHVYF